LVGLAAVHATEDASPIVNAAIRKVAADLAFFIGTSAMELLSILEDTNMRVYS
jgi:hypothetical protein